MSKDGHERAARVVELCRQSLKNIALYRAGWRGERYRAYGMFWQSANSAFLGLATTEWCKLFADAKNKHHWTSTVENKKRFEWELLRRVRKTDIEVLAYVKQVKQARDEASSAPLEEQSALRMPNLRTARTMAAYLHDFLLAIPGVDITFEGHGGRLAHSLYSDWYRDACMEYRIAAARNRRLES